MPWNIGKILRVTIGGSTEWGLLGLSRSKEGRVGAVSDRNGDAVFSSSSAWAEHVLLWEADRHLLLMSHTHSFLHSHSHTWSQGRVWGFSFTVWIRMKRTLKTQSPSNMMQKGRVLIWVRSQFNSDPRVRFDSLSPTSLSVCIVFPELLQMYWDVLRSWSWCVEWRLCRL